MLINWPSQSATLWTRGNPIRAVRSPESSPLPVGECWDGSVCGRLSPHRPISSLSSCFVYYNYIPRVPASDIRCYPFFCCTRRKCCIRRCCISYDKSLSKSTPLHSSNYTARKAAQCIVIVPVCLCLCLYVCLLTRNCVHRSSPNWVCSWLNFGRPAPPGRGSAAGRNFWLRLTTASAQCLRRLWALFSFVADSTPASNNLAYDRFCSVLVLKL